MSEYVPDPLEISERAIEDWCFENMDGDSCKCPECGDWVHINNMLPVSPHSNSLPICIKCSDKLQKERYEQPQTQ